MSFEVRAIEPYDKARVDQFLKTTWGSSEMASQGVMIDASQLPGFGAFVGEHLKGLLTYHAVGDVCELVTINAVDRFQGIGSALMDAFDLEIKRRNFTRVFLVTTNDNVDAMRFYQKRGWRLARLNVGAVDQARDTVKPSIPKTGNYGIAIRDELIFERTLSGE